MSTERRSISAKAHPVEVRAAASGPGTVVGHAAVYYRPDDPGTRYMLWDDVEERVLPGAFDRALREKQDVRCLVDHETSRIIGRTSAGTLRLASDAVGLRYEADAPDTQAGRDVVTSIKRGDVSGSSFSFATVSDNVRREKRDGKDYFIREITDVDLFDASPVAFPAYGAADAGARAAIVSRAVSGDPAAEAERVRAAAAPVGDAAADERSYRDAVVRFSEEG